MSGFYYFYETITIMQSRLIVKNFGPIKFVDLDLRNVNVFIGPQASGKSALAKLYTIFKAPRKFLKNGNAEKNLKVFKEVLEEYNIASFLKEDSEIEFYSPLHDLTYKNDIITFEPKLSDEIQEIEKLKNDIPININRIRESFIKIRPVIGINYLEVIDILGGYNDTENPMADTDSAVFVNLNLEKFTEILDVLKKTEINLTTNTVLYIPSERNFSNIIKYAALTLLTNNAPIPKHILLFGAELEKTAVKEIKLDFLQKNLIYKSINGQDKIFTDSENSIKLSEAASGIQSALPILMPVISHDPDSYQRSFVIEEPELNLFPVAQYELIKLLEATRESKFDGESRTIHTYTTHSPYILAAFNNLLYAFKVSSHWNTKRIKHENIRLISPAKKIVEVDINPDTFSAFQISNGNAESIFDREKGLIIDNYIDDVSDEMGDDFDALTRLML